MKTVITIRLRIILAAAAVLCAICLFALPVVQFPELSGLETGPRVIHSELTTVGVLFDTGSPMAWPLLVILAACLLFAALSFPAKEHRQTRFVFLMSSICQFLLFAGSIIFLVTFGDLNYSIYQGVLDLGLRIMPTVTVMSGAFTILFVNIIAMAIAMNGFIQHLKEQSKIFNRIFTISNTVFLLFILAIMLYPFLNTLAISFNNATDSLRGGIFLWPRIFTTENYRIIFDNPLLITAFRNSVLRTILSTAGGLFVCALAGYICSRKEFMFGKVFTIFLLLTLYVQPGLIPIYLLYRDLGLINNFAVYVVPGLFSAFNVIVIRTYIQGLPDGLIEAARIDGAGEFRTFIQIVVPISKPVLATVGLWIAVGNWNDWFTTFIYAPSADHLTVLQYELMKVLSTAVAQISAAQAGFMAQAAAGGGGTFAAITPVAIRSTITIVAAVPILCVYPFLQKYFVKGVHLGSVKG